MDTLDLDILRRSGIIDRTSAYTVKNKSRSPSVREASRTEYSSYARIKRSSFALQIILYFVLTFVLSLESFEFREPREFFGFRVAPHLY